MTSTTTVPADATSATLVRARDGAVAGVISGVVFAMLAMIYGAIEGPSFWAAPRMIATTVGFEMAPTFAAGAVIVGLMVHMMLSAMYGAGFAVAAGRLGAAALLAAGALFGAALYVVNFELFAQLDHFSVFLMMRGNWFEILIHVLFGLNVAAVLLAARARQAR